MHIKLSLSTLDLLPGHSTPPPRSHPGSPKAVADDSQHSEEAGCMNFKFWVHKLKARTNEWNKIEHQVIAFWFNRCGLLAGACARRSVGFHAVHNGWEPESSGVAGLGGWGGLSPGCSSDSSQWHCFCHEMDSDVFLIPASLLSGIIFHLQI